VAEPGGGGGAFHEGPRYTLKKKSPEQRLEGWKNQFADLEDKATDLRTLYSQLREQDAQDWLASAQQRAKAIPSSSAVPGKSSLKANRYGESKEMDVGYLTE